MGTRKVEQGTVGATVAAQVRRLREHRGLSLRGLSEKMSAIGRPVLPSGLSKIEAGDRRVDVDDLAALATALNVEVNQLLRPGNESVEVTVGDVRKHGEALKPLLDAAERARAAGVPTVVQVAALELEYMLRQEREMLDQLFPPGHPGRDPDHPATLPTLLGLGDDDGQR